jgi:hypothetical protein
MLLFCLNPIEAVSESAAPLRMPFLYAPPIVTVVSVEFKRWRSSTLHRQAVSSLTSIQLKR